MQIDQATMDIMHDIQYQMMKDLIEVMNQLNIRYFFVHGSLLGAIRDHDFIPEDDDIDIAIFRDDYNRLMLHGQALLKKEYFLQNSPNDNFPLEFGKMRKNGTAFIQPVLKNVACNKGIYIDIFPIDYENESICFKIKQFFYRQRINQILNTGTISIKKRIISAISNVFCLSYDRTLMKRELLYSSSKKSAFLVIYGGKGTEKHMPAGWFDKCLYTKFRDIDVACPSGYEQYLSRIYGMNYVEHNPAGTRIDGNLIEISAEILDFHNSYLDYS